MGENKPDILVCVGAFLSPDTSSHLFLPNSLRTSRALRLLWARQARASTFMRNDSLTGRKMSWEARQAKKAAKNELKVPKKEEEREKGNTPEGCSGVAQCIYGRGRKALAGLTPPPFPQQLHGVHCVRCVALRCAALRCLAVPCGASRCLALRCDALRAGAGEGHEGGAAGRESGGARGTHRAGGHQAGQRHAGHDHAGAACSPKPPRTTVIFSKKWAMVVFGNVVHVYYAVVQLGHCGPRMRLWLALDGIDLTPL